MPEQKVNKILKIAKEPTSFDAPIGDEDDSATVGDSVHDANILSPLDNVMQTDLKDVVSGLLSTLSHRSDMVLRLRFGIGVKRDQTLEEVGKLFVRLNQRRSGS
jgi:RNA polymerase primary sigma factor